MVDRGRHVVLLPGPCLSVPRPVRTSGYRGQHTRRLVLLPASSPVLPIRHGLPRSVGGRRADAAVLINAAAATLGAVWLPERELDGRERVMAASECHRGSAVLRYGVAAFSVAVAVIATLGSGPDALVSPLFPRGYSQAWVWRRGPGLVAPFWQRWPQLLLLAPALRADGGRRKHTSACCLRLPRRWLVIWAAS